MPSNVMNLMPGCEGECGCDCTIASDDFNRANETPIGSPWTKLSGTNANLASNVLDLSAAAFYRHNTAYSGAATESRHAKVKFKNATAGSTNVEVCIGITDVDNFFSARVNIPASGCPVLSATAVTAGVVNDGIGTPGADVLLEGLDQGIAQINVPQATVDEWHTLEVCLIPNSGSYGYSTYDELRVVLKIADGTIYATRWWVDGPAIGNYAGVKATGAAQFDDFEYTFFRDSPTSEHRTCPNCNTPCFIGSDDFTADEPCNWHQASGSAYSVSSGVMNVAASSSVAFHLPHPMYKTSSIINVDLIWDAGIIARVDLGCGAGGGTNGAGYVLLDSASTPRTMKLYDNTGTLLDTVSGLPATDGLPYPVQLCHYNGVLTATAFGQCATGVSNGTDTNPFAFLGAGAGNAPRFDNFVFSKAKDLAEPADGRCERCFCELPPQPCSDCCDDPDPAGNYVVDLGAGGWTDDTTYTDDCLTPPFTAESQPCSWAQGEFVVDANFALNSLCQWFWNGELAFAVYTWLFEVALELESTVDGCRWRVAVTVSYTNNGSLCDPPTCNGVGGNPGSRIAVYYSDYLTGRDKCNTVPVTLTKDVGESDETGCPCGTGTLPTTITLNSV